MKKFIITLITGITLFAIPTNVVAQTVATKSPAIQTTDKIKNLDFNNPTIVPLSNTPTYTLIDQLIEAMKLDGAYNKYVEKYLNEFKKVMVKYPDSQKRIIEFQKIDKKYPKSLKTVNKYFEKISKSALQNTVPPAKPSEPAQPLIQDIPLKPKPKPVTIYDVRKEMELFVSDLVRIKGKLEKLEAQLDKKPR